MRHVLLGLVTTAAVVVPLAAQGIDPIGRIHPKAGPFTAVPVLTLPAIDRAALSVEDARRRANGDPARYAVPFPTAANPDTHGLWEALDPTWSLWRLRIACPEASHVNLGFQQYAMPAGARMMVYASNYQDVVRPFDSGDHQPGGEFWTPVVQTSEIVCEVYVPTALRPQVQLQLAQVGSGYRFFNFGDDAIGGIDPAGACNVDVACSQGAAFPLEIPAIAAMSSNGSIFCTGSMINNTASDGKNYFLTAFHCGVTSANAASLVCYWNYQRATCGSGSGPLTQFTSGAMWRAGYSPSDFTLVELNSAPNLAWGITHAGWNRGTAAPTASTAIHHPSGDVKKISFENAASTITSYGGTTSPGDSTHLRVVDWDTGTTEGGSSGSPLLDQNKLIVGQLHGGSAACGNNLSDWYGRLAVSWTGGGTNTTRLSNWLDPINTGATTLATRPVGGRGGGGGTVAAAPSYGTGCYTRFASFAQTFAANTLDLGGTATVANVIRLQPLAGNSGYTVQAGANAWFTPVAANLALGDDALSAALTLPFAFPFPGGATTQVRMCSNGFVWLNGTSTAAEYQPTAALLVGAASRLAPLWMDLNPAAGGTCHFDVAPGNAAVYLTWNGVPHYGSTAGNTVQVALFPSGAVEFRYRALGSQTNTCVVGWGRSGSQVPPNRDLSATNLPFQVSSDQAGLTFTGVNRPLLGATQQCTLTNVPNPAASIGLVLLATTSIPAGQDLALIGAPGCALYNPATVVQTLLPLSAATPWSFAIPNTAALGGTRVYVQAGALIPPGTNAFGVRPSTGVDRRRGTL
ncbi:MAG: trypsin-like serine peptidase [Planctomycetota bacterium]